MNHILMLNENSLELKITSNILSSSCDNIKITQTKLPEQALAHLREGRLSLFLVDVPRFDMKHSNLLLEARKIAPKMTILVTSAGERNDVSRQIWRLGNADYLLKPYRPNWLVAAVKTMLTEQSEKQQAKQTPIDQSQYLKKIQQLMHNFDYKNCVSIARDYLDLLHETADNIATVRSSVVMFAEGLVEMCESTDSNVQWKLTGVLEQFRIRFDIQAKKFDSFLVLEKIIDLIFTALDDSQCYEIDNEQRIMNYIDRRIKQGISLDDAAEYAHMSSCYFSKVFKKITGMNFINYVTDKKIEIAQVMLLETDLPVVNIAYELSYNETNYFSKAFKKKVGLTPTEFREKGS